MGAPTVDPRVTPRFEINLPTPGPEAADSAMARLSATDPSVALVAMPFGDIHRPSLALSLLSAELAGIDVGSAVHYLNIAFAERIGIDHYDRYAEDISGNFLGEWIFSGCLSPRPPSDDERFVEEVLIPARRFTVEDIEGFEHDRSLAGPFLSDCLASTDWGRYRIIGFTTMFQQNTATLAFARMVKTSAPNAVIVFGGANCEGEMGVQLLRSFPWIDAVCTGEGDDVFPELARQILDRGPRKSLPGIVPPGPDAPLPSRMVMNLDRLPIPDFSGYFDRLDQSAFREEVRSQLPMETSRGCWWGEKHHCTFCGLNGLTMRFRSKSPPRAMAEITQLAALYRDRMGPTCSITMTDNILDMKYLTSMLPALRDAGLGLSLFYETKANLNKDQVRLLAGSGVREIQPGIESLSTPLLKLMRKGCTALQNIQLLKWCREFGITPRWSILCGFPGEDPRWFDEQVETIQRVTHLPPPSAVCRVRLDRFSPYFVEAAAHGISGVRPARALSYIYSLPEQDLARIAYHFDFDFDDGRDPGRYVGPLADAALEWIRSADQRFFHAFRWNGRLILWDGRHGQAGQLHVLGSGPDAVYEFCDRVRGRAEVIAHARAAGGLTERDAEQMLLDWEAAGLVIADQGSLLGLAVFSGEVASSPIDFSPDARLTGGGPMSRDHAIGSMHRRPRRCSMVRAAELGDAVLVMDRRQGRILILEGTAACVWKRATGECTVTSIIEEVAGRASRSREATRQEVEGVIAYLDDQGLLDHEADSAPAIPGPAVRPAQPRRDRRAP